MQLTSAIIVLCIITSVIKYLLSITTAVSSHTKYRVTSYSHVSILIKAHIVVARYCVAPGHGYRKYYCRNINWLITSI